MLSKSKVLIVAIFVLFLIVGVWICRRTIMMNENHSKIVLVKELHKAVSMMMADLRSAKASSISDVPTDGQWYHAVTFSTSQEGPINYNIEGDKIKRLYKKESYLVASRIGGLNLRRAPGQDSMLEVQIQAKDNLSLTTNFKVRLQE